MKNKKIRKIVVYLMLISMLLTTLFSGVAFNAIMIMRVKSLASLFFISLLLNRSIFFSQCCKIVF